MQLFPLQPRLCPGAPWLQWAAPLYNSSVSLTNDLQSFAPFLLISIYRLARRSIQSSMFGTLLFNKQTTSARMSFLVRLLLVSAPTGAQNRRCSLSTSLSTAQRAEQRSTKEPKREMLRCMRRMQHDKLLGLVKSGLLIIAV